MLVGLPGAGKSTLARLLAPRLDAAVVDRDAIRARLFPGRAVDPQVSAAANAQMERDIAALLRAGRRVIADGRSFATRAARASMSSLAQRTGAALSWIWLDVPADVAAQRIGHDSAMHPASDRTPALAYAIAQRFEAPDGHVIRLDACESPERLVRQVIDLM